jgi:hypothetical protein
MATRAALKTISIDPQSEVAHVLQQAADEPVLLELNGIRYRISSEESDLFANYDPERTLAAFERASGIFKGVDVPRLLKELRAQREQDSIGRPG